MAVTTFVAPLLPGKTTAWRSAVEELTGARREEYIQARHNLGITREVASLQQTPHGDFVVVFIEADDVSGILQKIIAATDPFHTWFNEAFLKDCHGIAGSTPVPPTNETLVDIL